MSESSWLRWRELEHVDRDDRAAVAADIANHIQDFLDGRDVSPALVSHLEDLVEMFEGTEWFEELEIPLASYDPWGGDDPEHLYTAEELSRLLRSALPFIKREAVQSSRR